MPKVDKKNKKDNKDKDFAHAHFSWVTHIFGNHTLNYWKIRLFEN